MPIKISFKQQGLRFNVATCILQHACTEANAGTLFKNNKSCSKLGDYYDGSFQSYHISY